MPLKPSNLEALKDKSSSLYEAIVIMGKRARQINDDIKIQYNQQIEQLMAQSLTDTDDGEEGVNPEQIRISLEFEKLAKPSEISLNEFLEGKIEWRYKDVIEE